jgi:type I restriction-modification system DNA methylase subunit
LSASLTSFTTTVEKLIRRFDADRSHYLSKGYSEAQARVDFITPFFKALGWDVENEEGLAHHAREVVVELGEDTQGRPDYGFRLAGQTKFFVEAKAPSEALDNARHIMQAKKYAWNTKQVSFVVLTDFEEFRFYDASIIPDERKPDEGLLLNFRYTDYLANIAKLWDFSPERVAAGSLEALLPRDRRTQRLRIPVDTAFLDEMTGWREELAKNIYKNNPALTARQLNEVVQRLLDRIVFIRVAEDRRVIEKNQLRDVVEEWKARGGKFHIFEGLNDLFHRINEDFNGEIFKPHLSEEIKIDSDVLARIIERLYPPKSPYRFDVIGVELLGSIYERYLGKTIRVTPKQVRVDEKPEVRKAGGVYYTPKYIVDYIVKNTVGKIIEGKTPKQIEKIRILDPACGSGSFLIGAFQCLIDYHARYLNEHPKEAQAHALFPDITKDPNGEPRLSVIRKAQILKNNLFGVDIDPQAVEITMMSLYLKALEGERSQLPPKQHLLPELKNNIICGNSLIGPDIYGQGTLFGDAERDRINAFDWNSEVAGFGRIMKDGGGFDCVIGNPPYGADYTGAHKEYFQSRYIYKKGKPETYIYFLERGISALGRDGMLGYITPNAWLTNYYGVQLRRFAFLHGRLQHVVDLEPTKVFQQAVVDTAITIFRKDNGVDRIDKTRIWRGTEDHRIVEEFTSSQDLWAADPEAVINVQASPTDLKLLTKIERTGAQLESIVEYSQGVIPYKTKTDGDANQYISAKRRGTEWLPLIQNASQVWRYGAEKPKAFIHYGPWLWCAREPRFFAQPKILFHRVRKKLPRQLVGTYDDTGVVNRHSVSNLILRTGKASLLAVLGLFNSKLVNWWFVKRYGLLMEVAGFKINKMPLPPEWDDATDRMVGLVERMLELNKKKHSGKLAPSELDRLEREIAATDAQIDDLVYDLYGITAEERKIIEEGKG